MIPSYIFCRLFKPFISRLFDLLIYISWLSLILTYYSHISVMIIYRIFNMDIKQSWRKAADGRWAVAAEGMRRVQWTERSPNETSLQDLDMHHKLGTGIYSMYCSFQNYSSHSGKHIFKFSVNVATNRWRLDSKSSSFYPTRLAKDLLSIFHDIWKF